MFSGLIARVIKAKFAFMSQKSLSEIVSQFHFFHFSLFEFAVKHMTVPTKHCVKKCLKVRPNFCTTIKAQLVPTKCHCKVSQTKRGRARGSPRVLRACVPAKISGSQN